MCLEGIIVPSVTWEHTELCVRPRPGAAGVISQTAVCSRVRGLDSADLQRTWWQHSETGVRFKGQWQVLSVLLPADDRCWVTWNLAAEQGSIAEVRWDGISGDDHFEWTCWEMSFVSKRSIDNKSFSVNIYTQNGFCWKLCVRVFSFLCMELSLRLTQKKTKDRENNQQLQVLYTSNQNCVSRYYKGKSSPELCTLQ